MDWELVYFARLLNHELRCAERYRRYLSLVAIGSGNGPVDYVRLLRDTVRDSDELVVSEKGAMLLMSETDQGAAAKAVERCKALCNGNLDLRFSVATFPKDGNVPSAFFDAAVRRLEAAKSLEKGAVVAVG